MGFKHNATESIPGESDLEYEVSDGVGSDADELYFHEAHRPSTMSSPKTSPMELIGKPVIPAAEEDPVIVVTSPLSTSVDQKSE